MVQVLDVLIERLRDNDPSLTEIDLRHLDARRSNVFDSNGNQSFNFNELLDALRVNQTITKVNLVLRFFLNLEEKQLVDLFEAIGSLPALEQFRLGSSGLAQLPLKLTNVALLKSSRLKALTLHSIHTKENVLFKTKSVRNTNDEEFLSFLKIVGSQRMESLESFTIQDVEDSFDLDKLVHVLTTLPNLKELFIQSHSPINQRLTQQSLIRLFASKSISSLGLRRLRLGPILPELLVSLEDNNTLRKLSLQQNGLDFECGMAIAYLLTVNQTLQEINLGYNTIPDDCGSAIAGALSNNQTLKTLDLTANGLELYTCRRLAHLLVNDDSALQQLILSQNSLRDEGVAMIAAGLEHNSILKDLSLAETQITAASCSVIAASLQVNSTLERLNLSDNKVEDEGCIALAATLKRNSTLKSLNLFGNNLRDASILHAVDMLKANATLERLNLGNNPLLTPIAYRALEQVLANDNFTIHHLWLPATIDIVMPDCSIPSFIRLNRLGRKRLLEDLGNAPLWVDVMNAATSDIHHVYFLLRANPTIVSWFQQ